MIQTQNNVIIVLERMIDMVRENEDDAEMFANELDLMLENLLEQDAFGTEGQSDPRGDQRNSNWTMQNIEEN